MDSPTFVVVPATCVDPLRPQTDTPERIEDHERSSSETTIVTIYSMYEEDTGSWCAPEPLVGHRLRPPKDRDIDVTVMGVDRGSRWSTRPAEDSAYFETSDWQRSSVLGKEQQCALSNGTVQLMYDHSRPPSSDARTSQTSQTVDSQNTSRILSNDSSLSASMGDRHSGYAHSNHSQQRSPSTTPVGLPMSPRPPTRSSIPGGNAQPSLSSTTPTPALSPPILAPGSTTPQTQSSLTPPLSPPRLSSATSSPSSSPSLVPSPDEDPDGFHVRSTYAQLEACGVRGDGYEEGVERTRARVGGSRASELRAQEALGDAQEKTRELTAQEISMLASLDRYGFYVTPSHDRNILLPVAPLLRPLSRIAAVNTKAPASPPPLSSLPPVSPPPKELSRVTKWSRMLEARSQDPGRNTDAWGIKPSKEYKLRERTFKGIPDCWRSAVWDTLICRFAKQSKSETSRLVETYHEALEQPSTYDVQIDLDVPRTISGHVMFRTRYGKGQRSLFHVLHSLSLHCEMCGYCQGMGPLAATLLCYFEPERAYASLVRLHDSYQMHTIFSPGFPGLLEAIYVQERIMEQMLPGVYAAFKKHMISTTSYATKWYITLFANSVPFQTQLRLWDAFLLEGHDIFVVMAVAIVWVYKDHITSSAASFETVLSLLSSFFVPEDENALLSWIEKAISDRKLRSSMQQWRKDWQRLVATGEDGKALL